MEKELISTNIEKEPSNKKTSPQLLLTIVIVILAYLLGFYTPLIQTKFSSPKNITNETLPTPTQSAPSPAGLANDYSFKHDALSRDLKISQGEKAVAILNYPETPVKIIIHKNTNTIAVVSTTDSEMKSPHNLYLYKNSVLTNLITGEIPKTINEFSTQTEITGLEYSPDGKFLFVTLPAYESQGSVITFNTESLTKVSNQTPLTPEGISFSTMAGQKYWSPNQKCFLRYTEHMGDSYFYMGITDENGITYPSSGNGNRVIYNFNDVKWQGDCTAISFTQSEPPYEEQDHTKPYTEQLRNYYYKLGPSADSFEQIATPPDESLLQPSLSQNFQMQLL